MIQIRKEGMEAGGGNPGLWLSFHLSVPLRSRDRLLDRPVCCGGPPRLPLLL